MVAALDRALRDNLGTVGLTDEVVTMLDPATGTGTFLLGVIEHVRLSVESSTGPGAVAGALRALSSRLFGFELLGANQLNTFPEFSIAFWRWAIWKIFESEGAPGRGVVAFISNRTFLAGKPYAGLRKMLRSRHFEPAL
jgi:predicted helicase